MDFKIDGQTHPLFKMILIRDKKSNPQGLPLFKFLKLIFEDIKPGVKYVRISRSEGYGLLINEWGNELNFENFIAVKIEDLLGISEKNDEWFYWLDCQIIDDDPISFGVMDGHFIYLRSSEEISNKISENFNNVDSIK